MFSKIALLALLVASVSASGGFSSFSYGVSDPNTGDIKDQSEKRVGGNVVGKYSLLESDGTKRVVEYSADDATGFKAVVHKEPAVGAGAIGAPLGGALAHNGLAANSLAHGAPLTSGLLAGAHANPWAAGAVPVAGALNGPLAHGAINPLAYVNAAGVYGQGGLYGQAGHAGLYGGYGNPLASSLGAAGHGAPIVSSYSHRIVHNGPDSRPYAGAYGGYGAYGHGYGAHGAGLAGAHLAGAPLAGAHANPWANAAPLAGATLGHANPWANAASLAGAGLGHANPWANGAALTHGGVGAYGARGLGYGSQLGW
ncbi:spidroin-1-like [Manduca sexta]|uniref:spidroin-1-like n=1 Tax=Manduca sexta TaxID=7130 RepID=UPI00188F8E61|nr:spidroin-1-like [Manduca sexta]